MSSDGRGHLENDVPGQKFGDPFIRMIGDAVDDGAQMTAGREIYMLGSCILLVAAVAWWGSEHWRTRRQNALQTLCSCEAFRKTSFRSVSPKAQKSPDQQCQAGSVLAAVIVDGDLSLA